MHNIILLVMIVHPALMEEIKLESLDDGPGLLPFNIGQAKIFSHYHSFFQYIDLTEIYDIFNSVKTQLDYFQTKLDNHTLLFYELQIKHLINKLNTISSQLRSLEPSHTKAGHIDDFDTLIEIISTHLDRLDTQQYNNTIKVLENNNDTILPDLDEHISLNKIWMTRHSNMLSNLFKNQEKINYTLSLILQDKNNTQSIFLRYPKLAQLLTMISKNIDDLFYEIIWIEDTLAFIRASRIHHSLLDMESLSSMINKLKTVYKRERIIEAGLREYYSVIKSGYYYLEKRIIIIFKVPIVSQKNFDLYKLILVRNKLNYTLIPPYPFIATNEDDFEYMETECPKFKQYHLCQGQPNHQSKPNSVCIHKLIQNELIDKSCRLTNITLTKEAIQQLDDRYYALMFPQTTGIKLDCGRRKFLVLHGSFLANIPQNCFLHTQQVTVINKHDQIQGQPLKITKLQWNLNITEAMSPHLILNPQHLKDLRGIEQMILTKSTENIEQPIPQNEVFTEQPIKQSTVKIEQPIIPSRVKIEQPIRQSRVKIELPIRQNRVKIEKPIRQSRVKIEKPLKQRRGKIGKTLKQSRVKIEQPIRQNRVKIELPIRQNRVKIEQPIRQHIVEIELPIRQNIVKTELPIRQNRLKIEQPITQSRVEIEEPILHSRVQTEQSITESSVNNDQPNIDYTLNPTVILFVNR